MTTDPVEGPVQRFGNSWRMQWPAVRMEFKKVREKSDGLFCELTIHHCSDTWRVVAGPTRLNLLSLGRNGSVDALCKRMPGIAWVDMLHTAGAIVARQWAEPPPLVRLDDVADEGPVKALVPGLAVAYETNMIWGDGASAKSLLALLISCCVAGDCALPWGPRPMARMVALYADWETQDVTIAWRARRICAGLGIKLPRDLLYIGSSRGQQSAVLRSLAEEVDVLRGYCAERDVGLFVADSVGFMAGRGTLNDDDLARAAMNDLRQLGPRVTRLAVHHIARRDPHFAASKRTDPFGSKYFFNGVRAGFEVRRMEEALQGDRMRIVCSPRKTNDGPLGAEFALEVRFDGERGPITFEMVDLSQIEDEVEVAGVGAEVLGVLRDGDADVRKIAFLIGRATERGEAIVRSVLNRLRKRGLVEQARPGIANQPAVWRLVKPSETDVPEPFRQVFEDDDDPS